MTPVVHGELPPPCVDFSFTSLDEYRTLMYGGFQPESGTSSEAYILNMETWVSLYTELVLARTKVKTARYCVSGVSNDHYYFDLLQPLHTFLTAMIYGITSYPRNRNNRAQCSEWEGLGMRLVQKCFTLFVARSSMYCRSIGSTTDI